jgi:DNA gyrase subunit A
MSRYAKGRDIAKLLAFEPGETATSLWVGPEGALSGGYLVFATERGEIKRTPSGEFAKMRGAPVKATRVEDGDRLVSVVHSDGACEIVLATRQGKAARFAEADVRPSGRAAGGVRGVTLSEGDLLAGLTLARPGDLLFTVTGLGYGKRSPLDDYRLSARGARGVANISQIEKTGSVVSVLRATAGDQVLLASGFGKTIRFSIAEVREVGRASAGVRAMDLETGDVVAAATSATPTPEDLAAEEAPPASAPGPAEGLGI